MFYYIGTAPDGTQFCSRSNTPAPYKVVGLIGNVYDSIASAATIHGARIALDIWRNRVTKNLKKSLVIIEATETTREEFERVNAEHRARLIADLTNNN